MAKICGTCGTALFEGQYLCPICQQKKHQKAMNRISQSNGPKAAQGSSSSGNSCFVATVAFEDPYCYQLNTLRTFRDNKLSKHLIGKLFIKWYYNNGEELAKWVERKPRVKKVTRYLLERFVHYLSTS